MKCAISSYSGIMKAMFVCLCDRDRNLTLGLVLTNMCTLMLFSRKSLSWFSYDEESIILKSHYTEIPWDTRIPWWKPINGFPQKHALKVFELREKHYFRSKQRVERCIVLKGAVSKWFCYFWTHASHFLSLLRWYKYYYFFDEFRKSLRMACFV